MILSHFFMKVKNLWELFFIKFSVRRRARDSLDFNETEKCN